MVLTTAVARPDQFAPNQELLQLSVEGERLWDKPGRSSRQARDELSLDVAVPRASRRAWLSIFFLVAFYAVLAVAFGNEDSLSQPVPFWNPLDWNVGYVLEVLRNIWHGGHYLTVFLRTFAFVAIAMALALLIGYPVAYFAARHTRDAGAGSCCSLLVLPFWINYLMRMLAWINLLSPNGWATRFLHAVGIERLFIWLGLLATRGRLAGRAIRRR